MPFRVLTSGAIECDTLEEAISLQRATAGQNAGNNAVFQGNGEDHTDDQAYDRLWGDLQDHGKKFLKTLASRNGEVWVTDELAAALGIPAMEMQKSTIHVRKMGQRYKIEPFKTKKRTVRGKFRTLYWMSRPAIAAMREKLAGVPG